MNKKHWFAGLLVASLVAVAGCGPKQTPIPDEQRALVDDIMSRGGLVNVDAERPEAGVVAANLQGTNVDDAFLNRLSAFPELTTLNVRATKITDASVPVLVKMKKLTSLDVGDTKMTEKGKAELRKVFAEIDLQGAEEPEIVLVEELGPGEEGAPVQ